MSKVLENLYVCPATHAPLRLRAADGMLEGGEGRAYPVRDGIPDFTYPEELAAITSKTKAEYDQVADRVYDAALDWQFAALYEDEDTVRSAMVDQLGLKADSRVLEVGCGTGRDSFRIASRLGPKGVFFLQDLSPKMVFTCRQKMAGRTKELGLTCQQHVFVSNATYLPFATGSFDAVFHFGGFNEFAQKRETLQEFARVTRKGGRILFGDEAVAPWLRGTEFEGIVTTNNPLFRHVAPLDCLPVGARDVSIRWIMGNCFYVISFRNDEGAPPLNLDLQHAGRRGGSMRTRYFGQLEGVSIEAKGEAQEAAAKRGISMHQWLDEAVRAQAKRDLKS
jgi:ubiquinone/menaquinone biosynthesis C-methylase UbiE